MERFEGETSDRDKEIVLDQALTILQEEKLSPKLISYFRDRVTLDFDSRGRHIVFKRKTSLQQDHSIQLIHQSISASSGMAGHRELAIIYGWEKMIAGSSPILHNFWVGIHPRIDWWLQTILINRLTELDTVHTALSISVDCLNNKPTVGEIRSSLSAPSFKNEEVYSDAKTLASLIHGDLVRLINPAK